MPDTDPKKSHNKKHKNDPKEQRKPRQQRHQTEKKAERKNEEPKVVPEKPEYVEPGPEFYQGLKRETDEILKITEEANAKYKKKEIKSNWAKYEAPIESYDAVEEQENLGADYEKLIQTPLSVGGHFQFKHEKSWDISTGPSLYDKYFDINMDDLATALCTIPFYERNGIDKNIFTENDIQTMDHRTTRYKHKYFKIATTESELQGKLIRSLKEDYNKTEEVQDEISDLQTDNNLVKSDICLGNMESDQSVVSAVVQDKVDIIFKRPEDELIAESKFEVPQTHNEDVIDNIDDIILGTNESIELEKPKKEDKVNATESEDVSKVPSAAPVVPVEPRKSPVIESPEDLEKWLDDFLDE